RLSAVFLACIVLLLPFQLIRLWPCRTWIWTPFALFVFFFSSRRRHTRSKRDWSSDVCSSDLPSVSRAAHCPASGHEVEAARTPEIGRASCRERVATWPFAASLHSW